MTDATTPRFDTFVFDLDGTLLDTLPDLVVLTNAVLRECGFPERTSAEVLSYVGNGVKALMYRPFPRMPTRRLSRPPWAVGRNSTRSTGIA